MAMATSRATFVMVFIVGASAECGDPTASYGECCGTSNPHGLNPTYSANATLPHIPCLVEKCAKEQVECMLDADCRRQLECTMGCLRCNNPKICKNPIIDEQVPSCDFMCVMYYGANSSVSTKMNQCMKNSGCYHGPGGKDDKPFKQCGKCKIVPERDGVKNLTSMEQIEGHWWVVGGLNYVYDSYPCDMCRFEKWPQHGWNPSHQTGWRNRVTWNNSYAYAPVQNACSKGSKHWPHCSEGFVQVEAMPTAHINPPGVIFTNYTTPLTAFRPQLENWTVVSFPHPEWMFVQWCGENWALDYAGAIILTKHPNVDMSTMPGFVRDAFRKAAKGIDYDKDIFEVKNGHCPYQSETAGSRAEQIRREQVEHAFVV